MRFSFDLLSETRLVLIVYKIFDDGFWPYSIICKYKFFPLLHMKILSLVLGNFINKFLKIHFHDACDSKQFYKQVF